MQSILGVKSKNSTILFRHSEMVIQLGDGIVSSIRLLLRVLQLARFGWIRQSACLVIFSVGIGEIATPAAIPPKG